MLTIRGAGREFIMEPSAWRFRDERDVAVGRHAPPSSDRIQDFMQYFEERYDFKPFKQAGRIMAMAAAHHRFNYIHPFPDGNGRVSRLTSHAMAQLADIGAHGLWSISLGLARGLKGPSEYKTIMDQADMPRQGDLDGRDNLSQKALGEFVLWFLQVSLDQVKFMASLFEINSLGSRLRTYVERSNLKPEAFRLLEEALIPRAAFSAM
jgi:Fic family protein